MGHKKCECHEEKKHRQCGCYEKKRCECGCYERRRYHVHMYCIWTMVEDCHRHGMKGVTSAAPDTPGHKHEYKGITSCIDGHTHCYEGCTGPEREVACGHVHDLCGKTSKNDDHRHKYEGQTSRSYGCR